MSNRFKLRAILNNCCYGSPITSIQMSCPTQRLPEPVETSRAPRNSTRGRSVAQYEVLADGGRGRKIAEYPTITAASKSSQVSYHIIRGTWTVSILNPSSIIGSKLTV